MTRWQVLDYDTREPVSDKTYATVSGGHAGMRAAYAAHPERRFTLQPVSAQRSNDAATNPIPEQRPATGPEGAPVNPIPRLLTDHELVAAAGARSLAMGERRYVATYEHGEQIAFPAPNRPTAALFAREYTARIAPSLGRLIDIRWER